MAKVLSETTMDELQQLVKKFNKIRKVWDVETEEWWFAVVDAILQITDVKYPSSYWKKMKERSEVDLSLLCKKFPMKNPKNNRTYQVECSNLEGFYRLVQSIPSAKAEPFKQWLVEAAKEKNQRSNVSAIERKKEEYRALGYDDNWISARLSSIATRNELTDEWKSRGVEGGEYGKLTNAIHTGAFDMSVKGHKNHKGVEKGNLRDHMTPKELAVSILGEVSTIEEAQEGDAQGFKENLDAATTGGEIAGELRETYERRTGRTLISDESYIEKRKRLIAIGKAKNIGVSSCHFCEEPLLESETYGTDAGIICGDCFKAALMKGEINEDGETI